MDRERIDATLAARLVAAQFPGWAGLPVRAVPQQGWDNRTFRLGAELSIRLPTAERYASSVGKEHAWLPRLAGRLPLPIPEPVAMGSATDEYPWPWSVRRWIPGRPATPATVGDSATFAGDLAGFLTALQRADTAGAPLAGAHSFHRGGPPAHYDEEVRRAIADLGDRIDGRAARAVWEAAVGSPWRGTPVWFHGDVAAGNLLADGSGRLGAVIDFGTCGVGDPACDLVVAWTLFDGDARAAFRDGTAADTGLWARARGWALWKALITLASADDGPVAFGCHRVVAAVIAEHTGASQRR